LPVVAIDGPASSGKSTVAKLVAKRLGFRYLDTGAMYRVATLISMHSGISPMQEEVLLAEVKSRNIRFEFGIDSSEVFLDEQNVTSAIRSPELTALIGPVCEIPCIRQYLGDLQRKMGEDGGVVLEGRDISTVVIPDAEVKIYLDASLEIRAHRRWLEEKARGWQSDYNETLRQVINRDRRDSNRLVAPLRKADDAVVIDTTDLTIEEVTSKVVDIVNKYREKPCV
jgi:cytidylate kinase